MGEGSTAIGPAIVESSDATCFVRPGWEGRVDGAGALILEREDGG
jgi:N-methylhydantoinase A/oxoprolinase/acetone carboxylase beta subunit